MKHRGLSLCILSSFLLCSCGSGSRGQTQPEAEPLPRQATQPLPEPEPGTSDPVAIVKPDTRQIADTIKRVGDWQLANSIPRDPRHWSMAPLYAGLIDASVTTGEPQYLAAVLRTGMRIDFELGSRTYHADGHAPGHSWLRIYLMNPNRDPGMLDPFIEQFDEIVENPILEEISFAGPLPEGIRRTDRWTWCDALYMSPPTIAALALATGDERYLQFMDSEYRFAYDALFDPAEGFFYRDATYIDQRTPSGEKMFWSRGNAWVFSGLALMLELLPADHPTRPFYVGLFRQMADAVLAAQQTDGFWYTSLKDAGHVPIGESSGTGLFVFGMAWGVRQGLLDPAGYWPAIEGGWKALLTAIDADGAVGHVQPFGERPKVFDPTSRVSFGTGAVLMAGAEMLRALGASANVVPAELLETAESLVAQTPDLSSKCEDCLSLE
jgi:unsaturated rhamnogalacturonyl hydrolase